VTVVTFPPENLIVARGEFEAAIIRPTGCETLKRKNRIGLFNNLIGLINGLFPSRELVK
jgi:hypothetical protein